MGMKKLLLSMAFAGLMLTGAEAKTLVVYFSATGNTRHLAQTAAEALGADIAEIKPKVPYSAADLDGYNAKSRSARECNDASARPELAGQIDVDGYDALVIAFPIWWYNAPKIVWTFVENSNLAGKKVVPICTSGGAGPERALADFKKLAPDADWRSGSYFSASATTAEVKRFLESALN